MFCVPKKLSRNIAFCIWIVCTFPKIVLKVSTDCVRCPKKTFLRIVCSVFLSEDCVRLNLLVCLFTKIVLKASRDCVLCPNKTFFLSEYCVLCLKIVFASICWSVCFRRLCCSTRSTARPGYTSDPNLTPDPKWHPIFLTLAPKKRGLHYTPLRSNYLVQFTLW